MKFSITRKATMLTIGMILFISMSLGYYFIRHETSALNLELNERAQVILKSLASSCDYPVLIEDKTAISKLAKGILNQKDVQYLKIENSNNKVLFEEKNSDENPVKEFNSDIVVENTSLKSPDEIVFGAAKNKTEVIGKINLKMSLSGLMQKRKDVAEAVGIVVIIAIILASGASLLLFRLVISKPISMLVEGTERIAKGDLNYSVVVHSADEIGRLAAAFNKMVDDLRESRSDLEKYNKTLELKVLERTKDVQAAYEKLQSTEEQLVQSAKMASLGILSAGVAHELNNPLTTLLGYAQILLHSAEKGGESEGQLKEIERSAIRCKRIIESLLMYSRQNKFELDMVDVGMLIDDTISLIGNQLLIGNIETVKKLPENVPIIKGNPQQLQQVFINMVTNAYDAMPNGGTLTIELKAYEEYLELLFSDTGSGIAPELIDKIFDPFVTTKPIGKGVGLGLSVSYGIIQKHNGSISVTSKVNEGTTFTIKIPLGQNENA